MGWSEAKMHRWFLLILLIMSVAGLSSLATMFYFIFSPHQQVSLTSKLAPGQRGTWEELSAGFDSRLKSLFPIGSPERTMANELRKQEFSRTDWTSSAEDEHEAVRREDNWVCRQAAHVYWKSDTSGVLKAIRGTHQEEGCL